VHINVVLILKGIKIHKREGMKSLSLKVYKQSGFQFIKYERYINVGKRE
jgi:hypothetical protein